MPVQEESPAASSLVVALTRAFALSVLVVALIMLGLPAVLALGAAHP